MLVEGFGRCLPSERLSGPTVEHGRNGVDLLGSPTRDVGALGEVLAKQSVGVLVAAALPRTSGISKVDGYSSFDLESRVLRELFASIPGERSTELLWQRGHLGGNCIFHR